MPIDIALRNDAQVITSDRGNYWRYYGLNSDPFAPGMLSNEIYPVVRWEEYCDLLHYLCNSSNALLLVTGIKGSGKTTFMHQFMTQVDEATRLHQMLAMPTLTVEQISAMMVKEFDLPMPAGESLEEQFESHVINLQHCKHPCLLIIDDAHRLSEKVLQILLFLIKQQSESQMRLHILLLGTPQLNEVFTRLTAVDGERELVHRVNLEALTLEETHRYIKHRLAVAGLPAAVPLSQATINRIHTLSEGILGRINVVARQALIDGMRQPQLHAAVDFIRTYQTQLLGGGILLLALIFMAITLTRGVHMPHFSMHFSMPKFSHEKPVKKTSSVVANTAVPVKPVKKIAAVKTVVPKPVAVVQPKPAVIQKSEMLQPVKQQPVAVQQQPVTTQPLATSSMQPAASTAAVAPPVDDKAMRETVSAFTQPAFDFTPSVTETVEPKSEAVQAKTVQSTATVQAKVEAAKPAVISTEAAPQNKQPIVEQASPVIVEQSAPIPVALVKKKVATQKIVGQPALPGWLLKADSRHFTIQLIGLSTEQAMRDYIANNKLSSVATYIHTNRTGKDWYTLVMGDYQTMQQAQAAIDKLPQALRDQHPWVRKMSSAQQAVKQPSTKA